MNYIDACYDMNESQIIMLSEKSQTKEDTQYNFIHVKFYDEIKTSIEIGSRSVVACEGCASRER